MNKTINISSSNRLSIPPSKKTIYLFIILSIIFISSFLLIKDSPKFVDERGHYSQIEKFMKLDFTTRSGLTVIPGYHAFFAFLGYILHLSSLQSIRALSSLFSFISIIFFFLLAKKISPSPRVKTAQYFFFPILFPFFFLVYTDVFSILLILLSLCFLLKDDYPTAGLIATLSLLVRQNNIVWLAFMCIFIYYEKYRFALDLNSLKGLLKDCSTFILGFALFITFLVINHGFAVGDRGMHPAFSFHLENIFFLLFLFFFFFLPLCISNFSKIIHLIKKNRKMQIVLLAVFITYMFAFKVDHHYNLISMGYCIRNDILLYFRASLLVKALLFIPIAYSILSICVTKLHRRSFYLLYPFTILYLMPSWLVEQRYYLLPLTLFILFKEERSRLVEYSTIIIFIILSSALFFLIKSGHFFP